MGRVEQGQGRAERGSHKDKVEQGQEGMALTAVVAAESKLPSKTQLCGLGLCRPVPTISLHHGILLHGILLHESYSMKIV